MIPRAFIDEWRQHAPWKQDAQIEQDLVISRAMVSIYSEPFLAERLAFRGGTALSSELCTSAAKGVTCSICGTA